MIPVGDYHTEEQIERIVEHQTDILDRRYLAGELTREQYEQEIHEMDAWAERQYARGSAPR